MRVITGEARGRKLISVEGMDTRPTSDQTKKSMFNAIQFDIEGRRTLDLFAGTGQLGIEALSRGAKDAVFVDSAPAAIRVIRANVTSTHMEDRSEIVQADAISALKRFKEGRFGLIFLDPPYSAGLIVPALEAIYAGKLLCVGGLIVCETLFEEELPAPAPFRILKEYHYGKTKISLLTRDE